MHLSVHRASPLTRAGSMMGSPGSMAPEQYDGDETTAATDQFSFCVSLREALYTPQIGPRESAAGGKPVTESG